MRTILAAGVAVLASITSAAAQAVTFQGFPNGGSYNSVASLDASGQCTWGPDVTWTGATSSPLDEDLSLIFRGPLQLAQFAAYIQDAGGSKAKRSNHLREHKRRHAHGRFHEKRDAEPGYGAVVTAVIDGKETTFTDTWDPPAASDPSSPAASPAGPAPESAPPIDAGAGNWAQVAYYNAASQEANGLTFLANDNWFNWEGLGAIVGYVDANGTGFSTEPQILAAGTIPENTEVILSTDSPCSGDSCGAVAADAVAFHGFNGPSKIFLIEFGMPLTGSRSTGNFETINDDKPAIWSLNTNIINTQQYGSCSCWASGCGELDIHEILTQGGTTGYSTMHMGPNYSGQAPAGFPRPVDGTMKIAVVIIPSAVKILMLDDSVDFGPIIDSQTVQGWLSSLTSAGAASTLNDDFNVIIGPVPGFTGDPADQ